MLVSFSDVSLNTVRYLQQCRRLRPDVVHVSAQQRPYPWFPR